MRKIFYLFVTLFSIQLMFAQVKYKNINSEKLGEERQIKIQLPRNYDNTDKSYPIVVVFDGDYLFEVVAGNVDYYSYWEDNGINTIHTEKLQNRKF